MTGLADILSATSKPCPMVLGLRLVPFSVGHAILLHRIGSPFVLGGQAQSGDLVEAVIACSQPAAESIKSMASPFRWFPLWLMRSRIRSANLINECEKLKDWIEAQSDCPEILRKSGNQTRKATMPWTERILVGLVDIGFDESSVLNMPVVDAERLFLTKAEMNGDVELWSDENEELWRYAQEHPVNRN